MLWQRDALPAALVFALLGGRLQEPLNFRVHVRAGPGKLHLSNSRRDFMRGPQRECRLRLNRPLCHSLQRNQSATEKQQRKNARYSSVSLLSIAEQSRATLHGAEHVSPCLHKFQILPARKHTMLLCVKTALGRVGCSPQACREASSHMPAPR